MNILYIHQYFKTPEEPGGTRSYWISKELIKDGHNITVLSGKNDIKSNIEKKSIEGINVIYIKDNYNQEMGVLKRVSSFINFMFKVTLYSLKIKNIDLIIATSTPLTVGFPALILFFFKSIPYIFEVRDLWPEVPIQMGGLNNSILKKIAVLFEKTIYKYAKHIVALSPGMKNGVLNYVEDKKISVIPNMAKIDQFWPRPIKKNLFKKYGLTPDTFKIIHFGSLGIANGAESIIKSALLLKGNHNFEFIFIGGGATEDNLKSICKKNMLDNVHFLGSFSMRETSEIVNLCDISIVSFLNLPILYTNSPNKLFDSLSAGKPIIVNSAGWTKDLVLDNDCGLYVNPEVPEDLVNILISLRKNNKILHRMGENSRELAENKFDKSILTSKFSQIVKNIQNLK